MILREIYEKDIDRKVNPAVSVTDDDAKTIKTEIEEYVFTDEILNGLCEILLHVKNRDYSHDGIWINGYFGSGKSHFLKYLCYCMSKDHKADALKRLKEAAEERDPMQCSESKFNYTMAEVKDLVLWLENKATIETIMFNIGSVHNVRGNFSTTFVESFWNQFNKFRGYNSFNISLAQHFEKVLDEAGKFQEFKDIVKQNRSDWDTQASSLAVSRLDTILQIGKQLVPSMSVDVVREYIKENKTVVSVQTFCQELKEYVSNQGRDFRLLFLADEVSQFINANRGLLLQLQEIVTMLHETCDDKVWVACTAQQDLSEILSACNITETTEDYGKIMGRFEVKVSLEGTQPEYITQKRILEKNGTGMAALQQLYSSKRTAIDTQFLLPTGYDAFSSQQSFVDFYPFVPYQFRLIKQVFQAFRDLGFVEKEVTDSERSVIKVTHTTAKSHKDDPLGGFIPFDAFYNTTFRGSLMARGQRAIANANNIIQHYSRDPQFGKRVVDVLFMICNMKEDDRLVFPATVDNITTLLMKDVDAQKITLKNDVENVLRYLEQKKIIHTLTEDESHGLKDVWAFYTEDESTVAGQIELVSVDNNTLADQLREIFDNYVSPANRETFHTARLSVGGSVLGKNFLTNNADIQIEFLIQSDGKTPAQLALKNNDNKLVFFMADDYAENINLRNDLFEYCKVQKYLRDNQATSEERKKTLEEFRRRAADLFKKRIEKQFHDLFDQCVFVSGQTVWSATDIVSKGNKRYVDSIQRHLERIYTYAHCADNVPSNSDSLKQAILRTIQPGEYDIKPLSEAETLVEQYLKRQFREVPLTDIISYFQKAPYGWCEPATIYFVNELVRRRLREFAFNGQKVDRQLIASNVQRERNSFAVRQASVIPQQLVDDFLKSWKYVFNDAQVLTGLDVVELAKQCQGFLNNLHRNMNTIYEQVASYPFAPVVKAAMDIIYDWKETRGEENFFAEVNKRREEAKEVLDQWKLAKAFAEDQLTKYRDYLEFVNKNTFNFPELPEDTKPAVDAMCAILKEKWPIDKMTTYKKLRDELRFKIDQRVKELKKQITDAYEETFVQLERIAKEVKAVDYVVNRDVLKDILVHNNILVLKPYLDTQKYYEAEVAKIMKMIEPVPPTPGPGPMPPPRPLTKLISMKTKTVRPLKTAADVDEYLQRLRQQLMNYIDNGDSIMVK